MKLSSKTSVFNMGDTSIRVNQSVEVNKIILQQLNEFMQPNIEWSSNRERQESFYRIFINEIVEIETQDGIELFTDFKRSKNYTPPNDKQKGLRARTLTNSLVKTGLINSERIVSDIGANYINESLKENDSIESLLSLSNDNLVYFRQYLKLRIYSSDSDKYFYNLRFAIKFLSKYNDVPQDQFLIIVESIRPEQTESELNNLIDNYADVANGNIYFDDYLKRNITTTLRSQDELDQVRAMFDNKDFSDDNFIEFFPNAKSSLTSLLYKKFVLAIIEFKENTNKINLQNLIRLSRDTKIKRVIGK